MSTVDRDEIAGVMRRLHEYYASEMGLGRPEGLLRNGPPSRVSPRGCSTPARTSFEMACRRFALARQRQANRRNASHDRPSARQRA